jgi:hypothetical protein
MHAGGTITATSIPAVDDAKASGPASVGTTSSQRLSVLAGWHKGSGAQKYLCLAGRATP